MMKRTVKEHLWESLIDLTNRVLSAVAITLMILLSVTFIYHTIGGHYYSNTAVVVTVNYTDDIVVVEDCVGNTWEFEGCEDWEINDGCALTMHDSNTDSIYDDVIVNVKFQRLDLLR